MLAQTLGEARAAAERGRRPAVRRRHPGPRGRPGVEDRDRAHAGDQRDRRRAAHEPGTGAAAGGSGARRRPSRPDLLGPGGRSRDGQARQALHARRGAADRADRSRGRARREQLRRRAPARPCGAGAPQGGPGLARRADRDRRRVPDPRHHGRVRREARRGRHHEPHADERLPRRRHATGPARSSRSTPATTAWSASRRRRRRRTWPPLAAKRGVPFIFDVGSGLLRHEQGMPPDEPSVAEALADGADLVTCSGDKLLGGPQAGIVVGRADVVAKLRAPPDRPRRARGQDADRGARGRPGDARVGPRGRAAGPPDAPGDRSTTCRSARIAWRSRSTATSRARTSARRSPWSGGGSMPGTSMPSWGVAVKTADPGRVRRPAARRQPVGVLSGRAGRGRRSTCGPCSRISSPTSPARSSTRSRATTSTRTDSAVPGELRVVATAGHVDHGKSSLIVRLTGIDPDRWAEEKRRGLTIDLGYAWCTLPSGREIGFVDVPGHERFIGNMLAGVGPVRLVLFVVAADEGWKPQSEEHLQILDVLGVARRRRSRSPSATSSTTRRSRSRPTRSASAWRAPDSSGAPIVPVSSETGEGHRRARRRARRDARPGGTGRGRPHAPAHRPRVHHQGGGHRGDGNAGRRMHRRRRRRRGLPDRHPCAHPLAPDPQAGGGSRVPGLARRGEPGGRRARTARAWRRARDARRRGDPRASSTHDCDRCAV